MPRNEGASEGIVEIPMRGGLNDHLARNATDRLLKHVSWVFGINFRPTLRAIADRGHLAATLADGPRTDPDPPAQS